MPPNLIAIIAILRNIIDRIEGDDVNIRQWMNYDDPTAYQFHISIIVPPYLKYDIDQFTWERAAKEVSDRLSFDCVRSTFKYRR